MDQERIDLIRKYKGENLKSANYIHDHALKKVRVIANIFKVKVSPEAILYPYIVDIFLPEGKIGIEIDGGIHNKQMSYDDCRDEFIKTKYKVTIIRFASDEVKTDYFTKSIWSCCYQCMILNIARINRAARKAGCISSIPPYIKQFGFKK